ncbi:AdoMet_MTases domain containing protein [uncultured Caudovirales phage]|uniref:AdoMet_MTases domain containing protein n=1 Tax=uncultured Caudovirales phage TaxID=2100421 RepID=A0A6J5QH36_9CAUD|nr:AdoMet_MTases domain containing protein [uncultured Caudovirales phage]
MKVVTEASERQVRLGQWMTPMWVADELVSRHFHDLDFRDIVVEPSCGTGSFLKAIPRHVPAIGVEIDPELADVARAESGREIITGDFRSVPIPGAPTVVIGNPPFQMELITQFLQRAHSMLREDGRVGFILPCYAFQTATRVTEYLRLWSMSVEMIPRSIYPKLREPLAFAIFSKDERRVLVGLALYEQAADVHELSPEYRDIIAGTRGSLWRAVCQRALEKLGGRADLQEIYRELEQGRPSRTRFWREKIRQTMRVYSDTFRAISPGLFELEGR